MRAGDQDGCVDIWGWVSMGAGFGVLGGLYLELEFKAEGL